MPNSSPLVMCTTRRIPFRPAVGFANCGRRKEFCIQGSHQRNKQHRKRRETTALLEKGRTKTSPSPPLFVDDFCDPTHATLKKYKEREVVLLGTLFWCGVVSSFLLLRRRLLFRVLCILGFYILGFHVHPFFFTFFLGNERVFCVCF